MTTGTAGREYANAVRGRPVRIGLLGTARINDKLMAGARASGRAEVVAIGSRDAAKARAYAAEKGLPIAHGSYEALLADPSVDAIYNSLPNSLHHPWTMRALEAGKHVLCEKPYSRHPAEVTDAFDLADARGLLLAEAFMWRHTPMLERFLAELPAIGRLLTIRATFTFVLGDPADIRISGELAGGALMDVGCYCVSGSRTVAGMEPVRVMGVAEADGEEVDRRFSGILHFPGGVVAELTCGFSSDHRGLEAIGTEGSLFLPDPWQSFVTRIVRRIGPGIGATGSPVREEVVEIPAADPYGCELDDFAAALAGERAPRLGRADALGQARTIAALYESAATGRAVAP